MVKIMQRGEDMMKRPMHLQSAIHYSQIAICKGGGQNKNKIIKPIAVTKVLGRNPRTVQR
jgi:hypothetical protein